ncbi:MAG: methyltransferase domain-containing protein, partial [Paracoccaceae bacterium]|nr:methyltransferase domain-containing protein [Paracoccaceae bacterium]
MVHDATVEFYDARADEYQRKLGTADTPFLQEFAAKFEPGQRVLDFGCGPGHCAAYFAGAGLIVDATDASAEMIKLATRAGVSAKVSSFDDTSTEIIYDGIWANFSLLHAEKADSFRHLKTLRRISKLDAVLHLGMKIGEGDRIDHLGRYYAYYQTDELTDLLSEAGFEVFFTHQGSGFGMAGLDEPWVVLW